MLLARTRSFHVCYTNSLISSECVEVAGYQLSAEWLCWAGPPGLYRAAPGLPQYDIDWGKGLATGGKNSSKQLLCTFEHKLCGRQEYLTLLLHHTVQSYRGSKNTWLISSLCNKRYDAIMCSSLVAIILCWYHVVLLSFCVAILLCCYLIVLLSCCDAIMLC